MNTPWDGCITTAGDLEYNPIFIYARTLKKIPAVTEVILKLYRCHPYQPWAITKQSYIHCAGLYECRKLNSTRQSRQGCMNGARVFLWHLFSKVLLVDIVLDSQPNWPEEALNSICAENMQNTLGGPSVLRTSHTGHPDDRKNEPAREFSNTGRRSTRSNFTWIRLLLHAVGGIFEKLKPA